MHSIPAAMTWEIFARGRWSLPAATLGAMALTAFIFTALDQDGRVERRDESVLMLHIVLTQFNVLLFGIAIYWAQGRMSLLYSYPVRTSTLVAWRLVPAMVAIGAEAVVSMAALNHLFGLDWPLWGPALYAAVAFAAAEAAIWLTDKSRWVAFALAIVGVALGVWFKSRYGPLFSDATHLWTDVTVLEIGTMLGLAAVAYWVAVVGVARNRRGEPPFSVGFVDWLVRLFDTAPGVGAPFRSAARAQFWFEWRRKGWVMPATVMFGLIVSLTAWFFDSRDAEELIDGFFGGGALLMLVGFIAGIILGHVGPSDGDFAIGHYAATRPMTTACMARTILRVAASSVVAGWIVWAAAFLVAYMLMVACGAGSEAKLPVGLGWWYFPATLLGAWIVVGCLTALGLAGRTKLFLQVVCGLAVAFIGLTEIAQQVLPHPAYDRFMDTLVFGVGVALVLGTAWLFVEARRRSLIEWPIIYGAASAWVAGTAVVVVQLLLDGRVPLPPYLLFAGIFALAVAPLAAAPLALAYNRNR